MNNPPLVIVWMCTYNHIDYIEQAVESVMSQKTTFTFKLILLDDCSIDGTRDKCFDLRRRYGSKLELILPEKNTGGKSVIDDLYPRCLNSGAKYIALCEGDDYWTDENKLQKQFEMLEKLPDHAGCSHNTKVIKNQSKSDNEYIVNQSIKNTFTIDDFTKGLAYFHTSSMLYRINMMKKIDFDFFRKNPGDWLLLTLMSELGPIHYIDESMSSYRIHKNGEWSRLSKLFQLKKNLESIVRYNRGFRQRYEQNYMPLYIRSSLCEYKNYKQEIIENLNVFEYNELLKLVEYFYEHNQSSEKRINENSEVIQSLQLSIGYQQDEIDLLKSKIKGKEDFIEVMQKKLEVKNYEIRAINDQVIEMKAINNQLLERLDRPTFLNKLSRLFINIYKRCLAIFS
ncbi:glycosyltransferase [Vibrio sp. MED222]|uniref:glycosyltransferase n=1 Tax=Vibrio sp. MED222 TaxID=314290 RepID=UPI000068BB44|nr:glycosyltransferase [Vibrio sp. MED222]EAQ53108.1 hypothetical protein MED222_17833 [Vibrio sp. MED222]